jgi:hypothetical protein
MVIHTCNPSTQEAEAGGSLAGSFPTCYYFLSGIGHSTYFLFIFFLNGNSCLHPRMCVCVCVPKQFVLKLSIPRQLVSSVAWVNLFLGIKLKMEKDLYSKMFITE